MKEHEKKLRKGCLVLAAGSRALARLRSACLSIRNPANIVQDVESVSVESISEREAPRELEIEAAPCIQIQQGR